MAGRVFETGRGPHDIVDGAQLEPGGPEELASGNQYDWSFGILSGYDELTGFTHLQPFDAAGQRNTPVWAGDIDRDGQGELLLRSRLDGGFPDGWAYEGLRLTRLRAGQLQELDTWTGATVYTKAMFADVNADDFDDWIVMQSPGGTSKVLTRLGDGTGKFGPTTTALVPSPENGFPDAPTWDMHLARVDADPYPDLFVHTGQYGADAVDQLALGDGTGKFEVPVSPGVSAVKATGDIDHDGFTDLVGIEKLPTFVNGATLRMALGDGSYAEPQSIPGMPAARTWIRDLDHSGDAEIIVEDYQGTYQGRLQIFRRSPGAITLVTEVDIQYGEAGHAVSFGDFDGNGLDDIAVSDNGRSLELGGPYIGSSIAVFYQTAPLQFRTAQRLPSVGRYSAWVTTGDFDNNGIEDLFALDSADVYGGPSLKYFDSNGFVRQEVFNYYPYRGQGGFADSGDFDGDGRLDLVVQTADGTLTFLRRPNGDFELAQNLGKVVDVEPMDLNGDARTDLVVILSRIIRTYVADAAGRLVETGSLSLSSDDLMDRLSAGDVDNDGRDDLIVGGLNSVWLPKYAGPGADYYLHTNKAWIYANRGDGTLQIGSAITGADFEYVGGHFNYFGSLGAGVGDFDGDGVKDLAITWGEMNQVGIYLAAGPGGPAKVLTCGVLVNPADLAIHDWNGDGRDDLAVATHSSSAFTFLQSIGRDNCPLFSGHYRLALRPWNIELLRGAPGTPPSIVAGGLLGTNLIEFRVNAP